MESQQANSKGIIRHMKYYLGVSCTGIDGAIALVDSEGKILFAQNVERSTKIKHAINLPADDWPTIRKVMKDLGIADSPGSEMVIAKTWSKDARKKFKSDDKVILIQLQTLNYEENRDWIDGVGFFTETWDTLTGPNVATAGYSAISYCKSHNIEVSERFFDHHDSHAANACFSSPFSDAVCVISDGNGEGESLSFYRYQEGNISRLNFGKSIKNLYGYYASLGLFYGVTICPLFGLNPMEGEEWKVMGLAPYGKIDYALLTIMRQHIYFDGDGLVMDANAHSTFKDIQRYRKRDDQSFYDVADVAFTAQYHFTDVMNSILVKIQAMTQCVNLVFSGGCANNSMFNGQITTSTPFKNLYVPSAPGDDGNAIGAAFLALKQDQPEVRIGEREFQTPYLGSQLNENQLEVIFESGTFRNCEKLEYSEIYERTAAALSAGKIIAWVQDRAEFGPRALGNRSILADPRNKDMKSKVNGAVKFREGFRPFAP